MTSLLIVRPLMSTLADIIEDHGLPDEAAMLRVLIDETYRELPMKKAAPRARKVTADIRDRVKEFVPKHLNMTNRDIGAAFNIDGGRITEIMQGKYDHLERLAL
jgi:hypothetical protein